MLRNTVKKLKVILGGIYPGRRVSVSQDMIVTIKNNIFSRKVAKHSVSEILTTIVPDAIQDRDISQQCRENVNKAVGSNNLPKAIEEAYELFVLVQSDIKGVSPPKPKESYVKRFKISLTDTWAVILSKVKNDPFGDIQTVTVRVKEKLEATETTIRGIVSTGIDEFDKQFQEILRYRPIQSVA